MLSLKSSRSPYLLFISSEKKIMAVLSYELTRFVDTKRYDCSVPYHDFEILTNAFRRSLSFRFRSTYARWHVFVAHSFYGFSFFGPKYSS